VFVNGTIRTVSGAGTVEALWVHEGRIAALGDRADILASAPPGARHVDLDSGTLTPGLIEPHTHPLAAALLGTAVDISGRSTGSREAAMARLAEAADAGGLSPWLIGFGWDPVMLDAMTPPTLDELDTIAPERPLVILTQMMHEAFANSAALAAAGIDARTPDPADGFFERDENGALTGRVVEVSAVSTLMAGIPQASPQALDFLLADAYDRYARSGYTTIGIASLVGRAADPLAVLADIANAPHPGLNSVLYTAPDRFADAQGLFDPADPATAIRRVAGIKLWLDGSPFAGGAAVDLPYEDNAFTREVMGLPGDWRPPLARRRDDVFARLAEAQTGGYPVAMHVQGERAIDLALDAIEAAQTAHPRPGLHHRLEHLALITPQQIERAQALGVSLGFFPEHIASYGHRLPVLFGEDRAARYMPIADAVDNGAVVTLHGDHPASTIDAMRVMSIPVQRRTLDGTVLGRPVPAETALYLMTMGAARQLGIEAETGSLEIGKRADLTWFDTDPVAAIDDGRTATVRGTWLSGHPVDTRPGRLARIRRMLAAAWGQATQAG